MTEPVRFYPEEDRRLPRYMRQSLQDLIERYSATILTGQLNDREYQFFTGRLRGLRDALEECKRITEELGID